MEFALLVIIAILVEATWENLKMVYKKNKLNINMIGSLILSIIICIVARIDVFMIVGIPITYPIIGYVITGIICSRGANFINDLFKKIKGE